MNDTNRTKAPRWPRRAESAARLLALVVASNGRVDPRELTILDELDAFKRLGVTRVQVVELAHDSLHEQDANCMLSSWPALRDSSHPSRLLDAVVDPAQRLLLCRLAAAVVTADGRVTGDERAVYTHMLARWGISDTMVTQAILSDRHA